MQELLAQLAIRIIAAFLGFELISRVPNLLHTPLMSATNAIHGVILVGGMIALAKELARETTYNGRPLLEDPRYSSRIAEIENELVALELTALRVVANSSDGKPHPASSVLKLRGSELQQAGMELLVDIAGPLSLASFAEEGSDVPDFARVATPSYLNYRKVSIYGGSNEVQRTIIAGSILGL